MHVPISVALQYLPHL